MLRDFVPRGPIAVLPCLLAVAAFAPGSPARGEVLDAAAHGFTVKSTVEVAAAAGEVYAALVQEVGSWWDPEHTFSGDAANLSIDPRPGGCFCERLPGGGGVLHLTVVYAEPGKLLRLSGGLGPLQEAGLSGSLTFTFAPLEVPDGSAPRTRVELTYQVGGYLSGGLGVMAAPVDRVLGEQLGRLGRYVETGSAEPGGSE